MNSEQHDAAYYQQQLDVAVTALQACDAALRIANDRLEHGIGHRKSDPARIADAADALNGLLRPPEERPGAWESGHVQALEHELRGVLAALEGGGDR